MRSVSRSAACDAAPEVIEAVSLRSIEGTSLEISINFTKLAAAGIIAGKGKLHDEPESERKAYKSTVKSIQQRGVPVISAFPIEEIIAKYITE